VSAAADADAVADPADVKVLSTTTAQRLRRSSATNNPNKQAVTIAAGLRRQLVRPGGKRWPAFYFQPGRRIRGHGNRRLGSTITWNISYGGGNFHANASASFPTQCSTPAPTKIEIHVKCVDNAGHHLQRPVRYVTPRTKR
jgi:hypothetical protein